MTHYTPAVISTLEIFFCVLWQKVYFAKALIQAF